MPAVEVSRPSGLTDAEAGALLAHHGPNVLPRAPVTPAWRRLVDQLIHFFALMLWAAATLAFVAGLPQLGAAIVIVVVVNAVFAFVEEHRADRATEGLRELLPRQVIVVRAGKRRQIDAAELVPGDLVLLSAGDRISADLATTSAHALSVDTSTLTGESVPAHVTAGDALFAGTFVTEGDAEAVVTATGGDTRLAEIATLTPAGPRPPSPLTRELHRVVRTIATIAVSVGIAFFVVSLLVGTAAAEAIVFAIGVTVALALAGIRCSSGRAVRHDDRWTAQGDPMEAALDALARLDKWWRSG